MKTSILTVPLICGLLDSVNPCALATAIIFIFLMVHLSENEMAPNRYGFLFIVLVFFVSCLLNWPPLLQWLFASWFFMAAKIFYLAVGALFVAEGLLFFKHWLDLKRTGTNSFQGSLFLFLLEKILGPRRSGLWLFVGILGLAVWVSVMANFWPSDAYFSFLLTSYSVPGRLFEFVLLMGVYDLAYVMPLIVCFSWILIWSRRMYKKEHAPRFLSFLYIIGSSILLACGGSMVYLFH